MKDNLIHEDIETPFLDHLIRLLTDTDRIVNIVEKMIIFTIRVMIALIVFWILRKLIDVLMLRYEKFNRKTKNKSLAVFSKSILRLTLNFVVIMISLMIIGVKGAAFAGLLGGAGLGIGFALKDTLSNFAGGIILIIFKAYDIGDFIEIDGQKGNVHEINVFATTLNTIDNKRILVPNGLATGHQIINYTKNKMRMLDILFGIAYEADFRKGLEILEDIAKNHPRICQKLSTTIRLRELGDSSVNLVFRAWCTADDYWGVYYDVMEAVKTRFDEEGISIPFPQMDVHIKGDD